MRADDTDLSQSAGLSRGRRRGAAPRGIQRDGDPTGPTAPPTQRPASEILYEQLGRDRRFRLAFEEAESRAILVRSIAALREHRGLTQAEFADSVGTTQSAISDFEKGSVEPRLATVQRFARALDARLEVQLWLGPVLLLNSWAHRRFPYRDAIRKPNIDDNLANIWLQPARLPERDMNRISSISYVDRVADYVQSRASALLRNSTRSESLREELIQGPEQQHALEDMETRRNLVQFLAKHRLQRGWSQTRLAKLTRISQSALSEFEKGITEPRIPTLQRWARAFGLRLELQLWQGPFVLFSSWTGRTLSNRAELARVALHDRMALEWHRSWIEQQRTSDELGTSVVQVKDAVVEPTQQSTPKEDPYFSGLVATLTSNSG